jgi:hypothetical protein
MIMSQLQSFDVPTPVKLSAAWAATVLCYIYCDYFALYVPGKLQGVMEGIGPFGPVSQGSLLAAGVLLIIPGVMVFLCVVTRSVVSRVLNIALGAGYTILMLLLAFTTRWYFYKLFAVVEALLTAAIAWMAWKWPKLNSVAGISR